MTVESFGKHKAAQSGDAKHWSVTDCLEQALDDAARDDNDFKPAKVIIHFIEEEDGGWIHSFYAAGVDTPEHVAVLNLALRDIMKRWET